MAFILLAFSIALGQSAGALAPRSSRARWLIDLEGGLKGLERRYPGKLGVFVKSLATGEELSFHGDESWYVASGVKVPIAVEVLRQVDQGKLSLDDHVELRETDFLDGAGETNAKGPGGRVSLRFLVEQMLIHSDNTASDILIRFAGLGKINSGVRALVGPAGGFSPMTTLSDVRRYSFGEFHPAALQLSNPEIRRLRALPREAARMRALALALNIPRERFRARSQKEAFDAYYASKLNSATLRSYAALLEALATKPVLSEPSRRFLFGTMARAETGKDRLLAGWPREVVFAHKTGTQYERVCDFGLAWGRGVPADRPLLIAACTRGFASRGVAESALKSIGEAIHRSGAFSHTP